jgi:hypothetical protein
LSAHASGCAKRAQRGLRGYPVATVALYGPDDTRATKLTVGILPAEDADATDLRRWFSEEADIRTVIEICGQGPAHPGGAGRRRRELLYPHIRLITITGIDDHVRPESVITFHRIG